ncbi:MAG: glycine cleavage system protein GcvH [Acholeplasmataceae bacterium]
MVKKGLLYAESHEWIKVEGNVAFIGISDHAQDSLGSIVFVDLPQVGNTINKGNVFGAVESVKAASDLYLPISGKVVEVNSALEDAPELLNEDAYENWIVKIEIKDQTELNDLLTDEAYEKTL